MSIRVASTGEIEHQPLGNQGGLVRPETLGTLEAPLEVPLLTPEDQAFMLKVEAEVFGPQEQSFDVEEVSEAVSALTPEDLAFMAEVEAEIFGSDPMPDEQPQAVELPRGRFPKFKFLGAVALSALAIVGAITAPEFFRGNNDLAVSVEQTSPTERARSSLDHVESTTTTELATTTTTEPVLADRHYERQPGELIGTLEIPAMCESIEVYQFDEQESTNEIIGTGRAVIDRLVRDPSPLTSCENTERYAAENGTKTRMDWAKPSSQGGSSQWVPIAGQPRNAQGPLSVYPGQPGNAVIEGHGSTFSAPFADTGALKPGDHIIFSRTDGGKFVYQVVGRELTMDYNTAYNYTNGFAESTLSIYNCADAQGRNGSDTTRSVVRAILVQKLA